MDANRLEKKSKRNEAWRKDRASKRQTDREGHRNGEIAFLCLGLIIFPVKPHDRPHPKEKIRTFQIQS